MAVVSQNAADSLCKPLAFQTDDSKNCGMSFSRQSTFFTDDEALMCMSRMTTGTSLFSDELPTTTTPMSLFSQEEKPVESSGKTGMPDLPYRWVDSWFEFEAPELFIAQEKAQRAQRAQTVDHDNDLCLASMFMLDSHFQLLDAKLASDELPTITTPMSLFSQEEKPVESSGKTGMPDLPYRWVDSWFEFEAPELFIAQEKAQRAQRAQTVDHDNDLCLASMFMLDSHFQLLDAKLASDELPTTTTPMSLFSQEEKPVESSGKTGMPDLPYRWVDSWFEFEAPELFIAQEKAQRAQRAPTVDHDNDLCLASMFMLDSHFQLLDAKLASRANGTQVRLHLL
ncbi:unnamed protein product [Polarella glacialis]|uniref:Uncharacterized protein n=1 Tax=Polarella glacialis TaxID=89957 RepID=A0A813K0V8_POLGL|nr:unnamed protein product [Polarella glacialis]